MQIQISRLSPLKLLFTAAGINDIVLNLDFCFRKENYKFN